MNRRDTMSSNAGPDAGAVDPDVEMIRAAYAAFARGDISEAVARMHPQVEWIEPEEFPGGGRRTGPAAVAEYLAASRAGWAELHSSATVYRQGDTIVARHHVHGRLASGAAHEATVADVFTVRDGLVVHMQAYADPAQADPAPAGRAPDGRAPDGRPAAGS
jgi:ketosteroid isomerase-like protein